MNSLEESKLRSPSSPDDEVILVTIAIRTTTIIIMSLPSNVGG